MGGGGGGPVELSTKGGRRETRNRLAAAPPIHRSDKGAELNGGTFTENRSDVPEDPSRSAVCGTITRAKHYTAFRTYLFTFFFQKFDLLYLYFYLACLERLEYCEPHISLQKLSNEAAAPAEG